MAEHVWRFFRAGGVDQVQLTTGADLVALEQLDQKLWVALACPVKGIEFDERTLALIDADGDHRVRANELAAAAKWAGSMLKDVEQLARASASLPLAAIQTGTADGKLLLDSAKAVLRSIGKPDATEISVDDTKAAVASFDKVAFNGDGVVPASSTSNEAEAAIIKEIVACTGATDIDRNGEPGVTETTANAFFDAIDAYAAWLDARAPPVGLPDGSDAVAVHGAFDAVRAKIDDFFGRVRIAAYDDRALQAINREQAEYLTIAAGDLHVSAAEVAHFPLARVGTDASLPLTRGINPAWTTQIAAFRAQVVTPLLGERASITADDWAKICAAFAPYAAWLGARAGASVEALGEARIRELASGGKRAAILALVAEDKAAEPIAKAIESVEKLVRLNRDLMPLANNFVSFRDFYGRRSQGIFQVGTLFIDRRSCELCVHVSDAARHTTMAPFSNAYLLYCDLKNAKGETMSIAAAVTDGDVDNLMVGRNGVFYDRDGLDWDATITRIVDNPISIRQAFWSPYKKLVRMIEEQVNRRAAAANERADSRITTAAANTDAATSGAPTPAAAAPAAAPGARRLDIGVVAAIGVAVGGITAALGALLQAFFGLGIWMPLGVVGLILVISGPSMAIAWLKLRNRNLGPLLDANGWAVNALTRVNVSLGKSLTSVATIPKGAERDLVDPFADKKKPWGVYFAFAFVFGSALAWYLGGLDGVLPAKLRSVEVLGDNAPASVRAAVAEEAAAVAVEAEAAAAAEAAPAAAEAPAAP